MKKLTVFLMLFISFQAFISQASASLISVNPDQNTYNAGDTINIDFVVNNNSQSIAEIDFDFIFDNSLVSFNDFTFNDIAVSQSLFVDSYLKDVNTLNIYAIWFDAIDVQAGQFLLGSASYTALSSIDFTSQNFELASVFIGDEIGNAVMDITTVPEPSSMIVMLLGLFSLLGLRKIKLNK